MSGLVIFLIIVFIGLPLLGMITAVVISYEASKAIADLPPPPQAGDSGASTGSGAVAPIWTLYPGQNAVWGQVSAGTLAAGNVVNLGKFASEDQCKAALVAAYKVNPKITAYAWPVNGTGVCYGIGGVGMMKAQSAYNSGLLMNGGALV